MQVLFGRGLTDFDGEVINDVKGKPATLRGVCIEALTATLKGEDNLSGEDKLKRFELALKVKNSVDPAELSVEEIAELKKVIGKAYTPLIVGQTWHMLEGKE